MESADPSLNWTSDTFELVPEEFVEHVEVFPPGTDTEPEPPEPNPPRGRAPPPRLGQLRTRNKVSAGLRRYMMETILSMIVFDDLAVVLGSPRALSFRRKTVGKSRHDKNAQIRSSFCLNFERTSVSSSEPRNSKRFTGTEGMVMTS